MNAITALPGESADNSLGVDRQWLASLELGFERRNGRTALHHLLHQGPLRVQKPFYPEGECCHVYLLHPPGGLVSGDQLAIDIELGTDSHSLITTPSAGKIYKGDSNDVAQQQALVARVGEGAALEWLPQETILFDGAQGRTRTRIELSGDARFIGWELVSLGRPASAERFERGSLLQQVSLYRDGRPLLLEKQELLAGSELANRAWGLDGRVVAGSAWASGFVSEPLELVDALRELASDDPDARYAISYRRDVLCVRYLGNEMEAARHYFTEAWHCIRPALLQREGAIPRIWLT
ncbi:urease accessory protein UreD [Aestuariirhabdus litorea]|uniref:Urease accessory protein UreD n=1 Tax=Aestuariirhabdus litorea TaxID=2528527 RepID=A0A3P3VQX5_9GAMM|nr:urease accessory protein UreD [Aestuariirhabdus litorea]RRJ84368.1 urease accessory protein UreD [Aestuariirhabdus litorea]RWW97592.1 urease accessory protein UreD [Endozoicomonadaceae bacterium GTF-13]